MAGFFKKLFNRIAGRKDEQTSEIAEQQAALPPPEPEILAPIEPEPELEPEPAVEVVLAPPPVIADSVKAKPAKPVTAKKTEPKKPELKKLVKKADVKPVSPKKPETKKTEAKKVTVSKTVESKKPARPVPAAIPKKLAATPKIAPVTPPAKPTQKSTPLPLPPVAKPVPEPEPQLDAVPEPKSEPAPPVVEVQPPPPPRPAGILKPASLPPAPKPETEAEREGWFSKLKDGLSKSSKSLTGSITAIFTKRKLDKATLQDLEDTLIQADLGLAVSERIIKAVATGRYDKEVDPEEVKQILAAEVAKVLKPVEVPFNFGAEKPFVILVVGVNGSGKTTTIGKLGAIAAGEGFKVKFVACDTFRAAAIEQLTVWGKRIGVDTMSRPQGSDASGLAFDAMKQAQADGTEIMFIDTAGRLHNKTYLMDELDKVVRVIKKYDANAPHAVLLVLDATTGQNAMAQAEAFTKVAGVTGLIMTKLDGTARGGILVAIAEVYKLPIHAIGVGEKIEDLQPFDADGFARAIAGLDEKS
jgi:fused signal recognition particle receptor